MEKHEKLAIARRKLKRFQARNSPHTSPVSLSGPLPLDDHTSSTKPLPLAAPEYSSFNGSSSFLHESYSNPAINLARPLTSSSDRQISSTTNSNQVGVATDDMGGDRNSSSDQEYLDGSILEHLTPSSGPPEVKIETPSISYDEAPPPPYHDTKHSKPPQLSRYKNEGGDLYIQPDGSAVSSGASYGGVLLKHIPYLPSSVGVGLGEGPRTDEKPKPINRDEGIGGVTGGVVPRTKVPFVEEEIVELEEKLKVHAQTIDILVSEKSALQLELTFLKTKLTNKSKDCSDWEVELKSTRQKLVKLEQQVVTISLELSGKSKELSRYKSDNSDLRSSLERSRATLEDQQEESTELISKVTAQSTEIVQLRDTSMELQGKLNMAELLTQQLSGGRPFQAPPTDPTLLNQFQESEDQVKHLKRNLELVTRDKDQVNSDLVALRDFMLDQQEENTRKMMGYQTQLDVNNAKMECMKKEREDVMVQKEVLERRLSTEHAQYEQSNQVTMETQELEREQLRQQLEQKVEDNDQLIKMNSELEHRVLEAELKLSRLEEESVDNQNLLTTMAQDKETLSRAMSQNKELKSNIVELEGAFVKLTHQNMELCSDLATERRRISHLKTRVTTPTSRYTPISSQRGGELVATPTSESGGKSNGEEKKGSKENISTDPPEMELEGGRESGDNIGVDPLLSSQSGDNIGVDHPSGSGEKTLLSRESGDNIIGVDHPSGSGEKTLLSRESGYNIGVDHPSGSGEKTLLSRESGYNIGVDHPSGSGEKTLLSRESGYNIGVAPLLPGDDIETVLEEKQRLIDALIFEKEELQDQLNRLLNRRNPTPPLAKETPPTRQDQTDGIFSELLLPAMVEDTQILSPDQLAEFQTSFNALQQKFVVLMREKADLLEKIEEHELVILKLASEMETVGGDYITLYQSQRDALRDKFQEKDRFIQQLMVEKTAMQANTAQLQILVRKVLQERSPQFIKSKLHVTPSSHPHHTHLHSNTTPIHTPQSSAESAGIPLHLRPLPSKDEVQREGEMNSHDVETDSGATLESSHMTESGGHVTGGTVEQIMELLEQLEHSEGTDETLFYCKLCTGDLMML